VDKKILKLGIFLMLVAGITSFALSSLNDLTSSIIAENQRRATELAMLEVYPEAEGFQDLGEEKEPGILKITEALRDGKVTGIVYQIETSGYGGPIKLMVAFDLASAEITGVRILAQTETPGLGSNAKEPYFLDRFLGATAEEELTVVKSEAKNNKEIQALTAATVTSKAVAKGINQASEHFRENYLQGGVANES